MKKILKSFKIQKYGLLNKCKRMNTGINNKIITSWKLGCNGCENELIVPTFHFSQQNIVTQVDLQTYIPLTNRNQIVWFQFIKNQIMWFLNLTKNEKIKLTILSTNKTSK